MTDIDFMCEMFRIDDILAQMTEDEKIWLIFLFIRDMKKAKEGEQKWRIRRKQDGYLLNRIKEVIRINLSVRIVGRLFTWERITRNVITIIALIADRMSRTVSGNDIRSNIQKSV